MYDFKLKYVDTIKSVIIHMGWVNYTFFREGLSSQRKVKPPGANIKEHVSWASLLWSQSSKSREATSMTFGDIESLSELLTK